MNQIMSMQSAPVARSSGFEPSTFAELLKFADIISRTDMVPKDYRDKPGNIVVAVQWGREIGLAPMQALQNISSVNGRPAVWGDAALALCLNSPTCESVDETLEGEGDAMEARCEAKRRGHAKPKVGTFSVADAKKANLWGKAGPWQQYPKRMLQQRARGFALRDAFPDVLRGLVTVEEAQDIPPEPVAERQTAPRRAPAQIAHEAAVTPTLDLPGEHAPAPVGSLLEVAEQTQAASAPDRQRQAADRLLARISALKTETELNALEADDAVKVGRARLRSELNVEIEDALAAAFDRLADQAADTGESFPGDDVPPAPVAESAEAAS